MKLQQLIKFSAVFMGVALTTAPMRAEAAECTTEELESFNEQDLEEQMKVCETTGLVSARSATACSDECIKFLQSMKAKLPDCTVGELSLSYALDTSIELCKADLDTPIADLDRPDSAADTPASDNSEEGTPDDAHMLSRANGAVVVLLSAVGVALAA